MDADRIPIRIRDNSHSTAGILKRLENELNVAGAKIAHRGIEILDLEGNRRPVTRRFPFLFEHVTNRESRGTQVVFDPMPVRILKVPGRLELHDAFVKGSRALDVRNGIAGKCQFGDFHVLRVRFIQL
jgi:hypothetical protein